MFKNPSFLFDIICTAAWIILVVRYARKGFLSSIVQLVGNLFSLLGAKELSAACAGWVFEHMLAGGFRTQIAANIAAGGAVDLSGIAEKYAGFLPASFRASIVAACERSIGAVLADNAVVLADSIVENVLQPLLTPVITLVLFFLFYALLRLLVSMLVTVLGLVNKLPVIGTVNRGLGWLVGGGYLFGAVHPVGYHRHHRRQPECAQRYGDEQQSLLQNLQSLQPFPVKGFA